MSLLQAGNKTLFRDVLRKNFEKRSRVKCSPIFKGWVSRALENVVEVCCFELLKMSFFFLLLRKNFEKRGRVPKLVAYTFKGLTLENIVASKNLRSPQVRNYYVFFVIVPPFGILHTSEIRLLNFTLNGNETHTSSTSS